MNSTLKSLVFWMVLVAIGVLVWNFSSKFQRNENPISFSEFISLVDSGQVARVDDHRQRDHRHHQGEREPSRPSRPRSTEGLANRLIERNVIVKAKEPAASPVGAAPHVRGRRSC